MDAEAAGLLRAGDAQLRPLGQLVEPRILMVAILRRADVLCKCSLFLHQRTTAAAVMLLLPLHHARLQ